MSYDEIEVSKGMADLRAALPTIIERNRIIAEITRAKYHALIKQSFTSEQAIELCKGSAFL